MDYRKPAVFGENWSPSRYQVLPYFAAERDVLARPDIRRILEIGCGNGWNMSRFAQNGRVAFGLDAVPERVALAQTHGPALLADGLRLPFADGALDMVYVQHVLHHVGDVERALAEAWRCLRPGGVLFLVETVEDNPIIRWGRQLGGRVPALLALMLLLFDPNVLAHGRLITNDVSLTLWLTPVSYTHLPGQMQLF